MVNNIDRYFLGSKRKQNIESELNSTTMARWSTTSISNSEDS